MNGQKQKFSELKKQAREAMACLLYTSGDAFSVFVSFVFHLFHNFLQKKRQLFRFFNLFAVSFLHSGEEGI